MTEADLSKLALLSTEQQAGLNDEQKAIFCMLPAKDQTFFAETFSERDLPKALSRKAEIMTYNQGSRARLERLKTLIAAEASTVHLPGQGPAGGQKTDDLVTSVVAAVGLGAASYAVATDNTARWQGVKPRDLVAPLKAEFENQEKTDIDFDGPSDALEGTIFLVSGGSPVPALTINLIRVGDGVEVKMGDLTSRGFLETLRGSGEKLFNLAQKGLVLWSRRGRGNPADLVNMASSAFSDTARLAELAGNLRIKERAWEVIKNTATAMEKAYQDRLAQERAARYALEKAWDQYYACPTCAVSFGEEEPVCRVCGTSRPEAPRKPDPRKV
jgi:hypothetical protein